MNKKIAYIVQKYINNNIHKIYLDYWLVYNISYEAPHNLFFLSGYYYGQYRMITVKELIHILPDNIRTEITSLLLASNEY